MAQHGELIGLCSFNRLTAPRLWLASTRKTSVFQMAAEELEMADGITSAVPSMFPCVIGESTRVPGSSLLGALSPSRPGNVLPPPSNSGRLPLRPEIARAPL